MPTKAHHSRIIPGKLSIRPWNLWIPQQSVEELNLNRFIRKFQGIWEGRLV